MHRKREVIQGSDSAQGRRVNNFSGGTPKTSPKLQLEICKKCQNP